MIENRQALTPIQKEFIELLDKTGISFEYGRHGDWIDDTFTPLLDLIEQNYISKEQHKEDVIKAYIEGEKDMSGGFGGDASKITSNARKHYKENFNK